MNIITLENIGRNISFSRIYGLHQIWADNKKWSCLGEPRNQHGFMYVFCPAIHIFCRGNTAPLSFQKGDLIYIPKGSEYTIEFLNTRSDYADILINFDILDTNGNDCFLSESIICIASNLPVKIADNMLSVAHLSKNLANPTIPVTKAFYEMLEKLTNHLLATKLHTDEKDSVLPALVYLDTHILDEISIPQLAKMCLLNESAFRKSFKAKTGMNPVQYKMHIKINKAKLMLRSTSEIPIEAIAETLGFYDNAYFHKVFAKMTGQTPKQYRDSHT